MVAEKNCSSRKKVGLFCPHLTKASLTMATETPLIETSVQVSSP